MLQSQMGQQGIAEKPFGKDSGRSGGEGAVAVATVTLLQFIAHDLLSHRIHFNDSTAFTAFGVERAAAVRATLWPRHRLLAADLLAGNVAAPMAGMAGFGAASTLRALLRRIGFEGDFG